MLLKGTKKLLWMLNRSQAPTFLSGMKGFPKTVVLNQGSTSLKGHLTVIGDIFGLSQLRGSWIGGQGCYASSTAEEHQDQNVNSSADSFSVER